jgi:hypothetical protein
MNTLRDHDAAIVPEDDEVVERRRAQSENLLAH